MIEVVLQAEPEGEISIVSATGTVDNERMMTEIRTYLLNTLRNSAVDERATEHYVRNNRRMRIIVGYLQEHLQHSPRSWRVILLLGNGMEFSRIDYRLAGDPEEVRIEEPTISRPTRFEHEPVI
jgi:hypothetical protein